MRALQNKLLGNPTSGVLLRECGGIRKIHWGRAGMGKSGSVKVFYYDWPTEGLTFFLAVLSKSSQENLSKSERNELASVIHSIKEKHYG